MHPGYGFLSENAKFADILDAHGITFIGPTAEHIRLMGDKITAKKTAVELGIPVVPGSDGEVKPENALEIARTIGFPVLIKATAGGGGHGPCCRMRTISSASRSARASAPLTVTLTLPPTNR